MADSEERATELGETQEKCVNLLYLASTRAPNCNPRELLQQATTSAVTPPTDTTQTLAKGSEQVGDKQVPEELVTAAVKPGNSTQSAPVTGSQGVDTSDVGVEIGLEAGGRDGDNHSLADSTDSETRTRSRSPQNEEQVNIGCETNAKPDRARGKSDKITLKEVERICPRVNCPERIVICMDMSQEMEKVTFRSRAGDKFAPIGLVKRALGIFLRTKHRLNPLHEFALVMLDDTAKWMCEFTNNPNRVITLLEDVQSTLQTETFDMASVFDEVRQRVPLPRVEDPSIIPPPYIVRVLFLYGRSSCIPKFSSRESEKVLQSSPHFFLDAFYIHEPPSEDNEAEKIFEDICELDSKGLSYVFEVSRNPTKLYDCMAQLLPHPLQRPIQRDCFYSIESKPEIIQ